MGKLLLSIHKQSIISYSYDGLVMVRAYDNLNISDVVIMPHHRREGGVLKGYITPGGKYILTLGRDNNLVCTSLNHIKEELINTTDSEKFATMFGRPTLGFMLKGKFIFVT